MSKLEYGIFTKAWQPIVGCNMELPCAKRCWARRTMARVAECQVSNPSKRGEFYRQFVDERMLWTGKVGIDEDHLLDPSGWKKSQTVATGFHGDIGLLDRLSVSKIMRMVAWCRQHRYFALTKRVENIVRYCEDYAAMSAKKRSQVLMAEDSGCVAPIERCGELEWPFPWMWWGTSISDQSEADERLPHLMRLAAAGWKTFVFIEPMLGPIKLSEVLKSLKKSPKWIVLGGESGPNSRPMHPDWARSVRDQCAAAGVPFWFKQWGDWAPEGPQYPDEYGIDDDNLVLSCRDFPSKGILYRDGYFYDGMEYQPHTNAGAYWMEHVGKKAAGHLLDGREHHEFPAE